MQIINNRLALTYQELTDTFKLSKNTVNFGIGLFRSGGNASWECLKQGKQVLIFVDSIPAATRSKLPPEAELLAQYHEDQKSGIFEAICKQLKYAQQNKFMLFQKDYREQYGLDAKKALEKGMKAAVWQRLTDLHNEYSNGGKAGLQRGIGEALYYSYNKLYPDNYSSPQAFSRALSQVKLKGAFDYCIDGRLIKNSETPANQKFDSRHVFLLRAIVSSGKAYKVPFIAQKMAEGCKELGIPCPSASWIRDNKRKALENIELYANRYGSEQAGKLMPYADIEPAYFADDQYQIDGWDLPFYYVGVNKAGLPRLKKLVLIAVKDAYSRKIVGYSIGRSENRLTLFEALQDAVSNTGALPHELVTDNHSYNETKEIANFKECAELIGFHWTVDSNPRRKAITERGFGDLGNRICKEHYAYVGQGIKTKDKDGRTSQELLDKYQKAGKVLTEEAIKVIGIEVVERYNRTKLPSKNITPEQLYAESEKPHRKEVDLLNRLRLFTKQTAYKVTQGQINIEIAGTEYHYRLPAEYFAAYNSKKVTVRYESPELIYLFDTLTDNPITSLKRKERIAGALANQTADDIDKMNRNKGHIKGIKTKARKENEGIAEQALALSPGIYDIANRLTTPKDLKQILEEDRVTQQAIKRGIDINRLVEIQTFSEIDNEAFKKPKLSKTERSPYQPQNHVMTEIIQDDL